MKLDEKEKKRLIDKYENRGRKIKRPDKKDYQEQTDKNYKDGDRN